MFWPLRISIRMPLEMRPEKHTSSREPIPINRVAQPPWSKISIDV